MALRKKEQEALARRLLSLSRRYRRRLPGKFCRELGGSFGPGAEWHRIFSRSAAAGRYTGDGGELYAGARRVHTCACAVRSVARFGEEAHLHHHSVLSS